MSDFVLILRLAIVAILIVTLAVLGARVNGWWCNRWRCLLPAAGTGAIAFFFGSGTVINLLRELPGGLNTVCILLGSIVVLLQACTVGLSRPHVHEVAALQAEHEARQRLDR